MTTESAVLTRKWFPDRVRRFRAARVMCEPEFVGERFGLKVSAIRAVAHRHGATRQPAAKPWTPEEEALVWGFNRMRKYTPTVRQLLPHRSEKAIRLKLARLRASMSERTSK